MTRVVGAPPQVPVQVPDRSGSPWGAGGGGTGCCAFAALPAIAMSNAAIVSLCRRMLMMTSCTGELLTEDSTHFLAHSPSGLTVGDARDGVLVSKGLRPHLHRAIRIRILKIDRPAI